MTQTTMYEDIAKRTGGEIYIGVVGPVRTGKSTFIKRFMETMVLPNMENGQARLRAVDELPQSAAGRTIMTTEPKFIPEQAATVTPQEGVTLKARLVDCVGYMVSGSMGAQENEKPRMVKSPWFPQEVPFDTAAEIGTQKVITDHSTIGLVVTTDGSISDIPRENYEPAEERVVRELETLGKPFVILLNCISPQSPAAGLLAQKLTERYGHRVLPVSCLELEEENIQEILKTVLYEFPIKELAFCMPKWVTMLEKDHWLQQGVYAAVQDFAERLRLIRDVLDESVPACDYLQQGRVLGVELGSGCVRVELVLKNELFYRVLTETTGLEICDEAGLMPCVIRLAKIKEKYEKVRSALEQVEATGYGIVMPTLEELTLEEPEIIRQGGRYGVRLSASAPSIHMMKTEIHTEVAPIVGNERQSEELVHSMLQDFEENPLRIWESNIFGKSLYELVNEGLRAKMQHIPQEARTRLQETLERVINEGCNGLICIII